jgi:hypothetical protein
LSAAQVVQLTRMAWLGGAVARPLNVTAAPEPKRMAAESQSRSCAASARPARPWGALFVALVAVVSVLAIELWAVREAPTLDRTAARQVVAEVSATLARVAAASYVVHSVN